MIINNTIAAIDAIGEADAILITAGAGMSASSGLPTFRGDDGFWKAYPAAEKAGLSFADLANPAAFHTEPRLAWGFYAHRLNLYRNTAPHPGYGRLLDLIKGKEGGGFVFTSNVDGAFQVSGFSPAQVLECHGSIHSLQCIDGCGGSIWPADRVELEIDADLRAVGDLPSCPHCGGLARPNILMFGDGQWISTDMEKQERAYQLWLDDNRSFGARFVVIEVGAGRDIPTVRNRSEGFARMTGGQLIRINPDPYHAWVPKGGISIQDTALGGLGAILDPYT